MSLCNCGTPYCEHQESSKRLTAGNKTDGGKPRFSLLPIVAINAVIRVMEFGAKKYGVENWRKVDNARERYYNAGMRHFTVWWEGEQADPDTGESHLAHLMCCVVFLLTVDLEKK